MAVDKSLSDVENGRNDGRQRKDIDRDDVDRSKPRFYVRLVKIFLRHLIIHPVERLRDIQRLLKDHS